MVEQPMFGRRLRQLRTERGLTLAALAGDGMSTGYLSRLESGARQPSEQALAHLSDRLGISTAQLVESTASSLAQSLTLATGLSLDETGELLAGALDASAGEDPLLRWQALWRVADWRRQRREFAEERACLEELAAIADQFGPWPSSHAACGTPVRSRRLSTPRRPPIGWPGMAKSTTT